eukprot:TRINITY_DN5171_c0_g1_i1.p1 TRINITY_DN5171_c0_g1~~TRINITY_DN5171_c0_g1_i1.p1  ORF type:complete len:872 (+),score=260.25 TRINITY_DN5171_c0_g1_i1:84-2699(+)
MALGRLSKGDHRPPVRAGSRERSGSRERVGSLQSSSSHHAPPTRTDSLRAMRADAEALAQECEKLRSREKDYLSELSHMRQQVAELNRHAALQGTTTAERETEVASLKNQLKASEQVVATLDKQLSAGTNAQERLQMEQEALKAEIAELKEKDTNWAALTERLKQEYYTIVQQWGDMEESVQRTQEELGRKRRGEIKALEDHLADEKAKRQDAAQKVVSQQIELERCKTDIDQVYAQLEERTRDAAREKETYCTGEEQKRAVLAAEAQLKEEILKKALAAARQGEQYQLKRFRDLKQRYLKKKQACEAAGERVVELNKEILQYKLQVASLETTNQQKDTKLHVMEREVADVQQANLGLHQHLHTLRLQYKEVTMERTANGSPRPATPRGQDAWDGSDHPSRRSHPRSTLRSGMRSSSAGGKAHLGSLSPPRHGTKLRWMSASPPPFKNAPPFCSTVKPQTPPLTLLQNGPTRDAPFANDSPAMDPSFRYTPPPAIRQYVLTEAGRADVGPASRTHLLSRHKPGAEARAPLSRRSSSQRSLTAGHTPPPPLTTGVLRAQATQAPTPKEQALAPPVSAPVPTASVPAPAPPAAAPPAPPLPASPPAPAGAQDGTAFAPMPAVLPGPPLAVGVKAEQVEETGRLDDRQVEETGRLDDRQVEETGGLDDRQVEETGGLDDRQVEETVPQLRQVELSPEVVASEAVPANESSVSLPRGLTKSTSPPATDGIHGTHGTIMSSVPSVSISMTQSERSPRARFDPSRLSPRSPSRGKGTFATDCTESESIAFVEQNDTMSAITRDQSMTRDTSRRTELISLDSDTTTSDLSDDDSLTFVVEGSASQSRKKRRGSSMTSDARPNPRSVTCEDTTMDSTRS